MDVAFSLGADHHATLMDGLLPRTLRPRRYQLTKDAALAVTRGHPWVFRKQMSSAAERFADGQWLRLVDGQNKVLGHGTYDAEGAIAVRVVGLPGGKPCLQAPNAKWVKEAVKAALRLRGPLRETTNAFRALHGENDGLPGVVVDVYGDVAILQTYSRGADALGRFAVRCLRRELGLAACHWRPGAKRVADAPPARTLWGVLPDEVHAREDDRRLVVQPGGGQKSGAFLDLRGLRRWLAAQSLGGGRVLNLFAYTGTLSAAAEAAGADEIWSVDVSAPALVWAKEHHAQSDSKHRFVLADVFEWLQRLPQGELFDVVIVDPPQMTSRADQLPQVVRAYEKLYAAAIRHVHPGGLLVAACCTSRMDEATFRATVESGLHGGAVFERRLAPEPDHPVRYPQADYLKILLYKAR